MSLGGDVCLSLCSAFCICCSESCAVWCVWTQCGGNQCCGSNKLNDDEFEKEEARLHAEGARLERERATSLERSSNEGKDTSAATDTQPTARDTMRAQFSQFYLDRFCSCFEDSAQARFDKCVICSQGRRFLFLHFVVLKLFAE
ncbi:unnamed protein product [Somion occarium]|uniref:Secreted protein n=1 Tax=Somion occarium TaxID=3059160 RepID=A0ABP1DS56_9APHY